MALTGRQWIVAVIATTGVLSTISVYGVLAPFYPIEARLKNNDNFQIGLIFAAYSVVGLCSSPFVGYLLSTGMSARRVLVVGLGIGGSFFALMGFLERVPAGLPFFGANLGMRLVQTFGTTICQPCFYSLVATELKEYRNVAVATLESMYGLAMMIGPAVGGVLYDLGGYSLPFFFFGAVVAAMAVLVALLLPDATLSPEPATRISWKSLDAALVVDLLAVVCAHSITGYNDLTLSKQLMEYGMTFSDVGLVFLICAASYGTSSIAWGYLVRRVGDARRLVVVGALFSALALFLMRPIEMAGVQITLPFQIGAQALLGSGLSALYVCSILHGMHHAVHRLGYPDDISTHGFVSGLFMTAMFMGLLIGTALGGLLTDWFGYRTALATWSSAAMLTASAVAIALFSDRPNKLASLSDQ